MEDLPLNQMGLNINKIREERTISKSKLAKDAGITRKMLENVEAGGDCCWSTLFKLCRALNMEFHEVAMYHLTVKELS